MSSLFSRFTVGGILAAALTVAAPALAQYDPISTDRPDFSESPFIVPLGRTQLEMGYTFSRSGSTADHAIGEFLIRRALNPRTELRFLVNAFHVTEDSGFTTSGFDDVGLAVKWKLLDGSDKPLFRPHLALITGLTFPSGSSIYRESHLQPSVALTASLPLSERISVQSNLGYINASQGQTFSEFYFSSSFGFTLSEKWGAFVEYYTLLPGGYRGANANYVNAGLTYLLDNDTQLDIRAGQGFNSPQPDYFVGVGISRRW